jgi:hypothetical protein
MIYDIRDGAVNQQEEHSLIYDQPDQLISILQEKKVSALVCGGCPRFFQRMFRFHDVEVIAGMTGNPEHVVKALLQGKLHSLPEDTFPGARCRHRGKKQKANLR